VWVKLFPCLCLEIIDEMNMYSCEIPDFKARYMSPGQIFISSYHHDIKQRIRLLYMQVHTLENRILNMCSFFQKLSKKNRTYIY